MTSLVLGLILNGPTFNIRDFGAIGDGFTMNTKSIQAAIDRANKVGGGTVLVPDGRFLTGTIHLKSNINLHVSDKATILGSTKRKDYEKIIWYTLISAHKVHDVKITGTGTIDGQGAELAQDILHLVDTGEVKIPPKRWRPSELDRPEIIEMNFCKNVSVLGVTIKNSCCWVQTYRECEGLLIDGIRVDSKSYWNNDGIDILDCKKAIIRNCDIDACDDGICLKSDNPKLKCEDISITNCKVRSSASAIKFGTSSHGGFKNIRIDNCQVRDTFRSVIALESVDGAILENINVGNIKAVNTGNAFFIRIGHRTLNAPVGRVRNINLHDIDVEVPAIQPDLGYAFKGPDIKTPHNVMPSSIMGHKQFPIENVRLERIKIHYPGGGTTSVANAPVTQLSKIPEFAEQYPEFNMFGELPAWGLFVRHAKGISMKDCTFELAKADYRPAIVFDDVVNFKASRCYITGRDTKPLIVARKSKQISTPGLKIKTVN